MEHFFFRWVNNLRLKRMVQEQMRKQTFNFEWEIYFSKNCLLFLFAINHLIVD